MCWAEGGHWTIPGCRDTDRWPGLVTTPDPALSGGWGEVRGPRPGITALKWSVITTNFTLLRPLSALSPGNDRPFLSIIFQSHYIPNIIYRFNVQQLSWMTLRMFKQNRLKLKVSRQGDATMAWWNSKNVFQFTAWISMVIKISYIQVPKSLDGTRISPSRD